MSTLEMDFGPTKGRNLSPHLIETSLQKRYTTISIPSTYGGLNEHLTSGAVVGIVLGSVAGFVLLMYVLFLAVSPKSVARGPPTAPSSYTSKDSSVYLGHARSSRHPRRDEERSISAHSFRRRSRSRSDRIVVEESQTSGPSRNDVIEVLEDDTESEFSRPPRRPSRRGGGRHVDPLAYGGSQNSRA